jgi:NB-ARC domain
MATRSSRTAERMGPAEHNLPVPLTSLVGRARELELIGETLRRTRPVTLTGPGGVGKTRLALTLAHDQLGRRGDGVWLVDLSAGSEAPDVAAETARILGVRGASGTSPTDALRSYLRNRDVLLVLDNCEHVVDACAELAAALLSSCGDVRIMTASRESLRVEGETVWRLEPLAPEDAYRLFVERARRRRPEPTDQRPRLPSGRAPQPAGARAWTAVKAIVWVHQRGSAQWARNRSMSWSSTFAESTSRSRSSTTVWVQ